MRALYVSYFGLRQPLVQTQVLPYLRELARGGVDIHLLTFEPEAPPRWQADAARRRDELRRHGITWHWRRYHKRPALPATLWDILAGAHAIRNLDRLHHFNILHGRNHIATQMCRLARRERSQAVIFDIRGLFAEEYVDAGLWRQGGALFRLAKAHERRLLREADGFVVLTRRARQALFGDGRGATADGRPIEVIPCCVDLDAFPDSAEDRCRAPGGSTRLVYAGSVTGLYRLGDMCRFATHFRPSAPINFSVFTHHDEEATRAAIANAGLAPHEYSVACVEPSSIPRELRRAHIGVSFRTETHSQIAASPTKIAEYLAAGLPVVSSARVGDTDELLSAERVGVIVRDWDDRTLRATAEQASALALDPITADRCRRVARDHFDLRTVGGPAYRRLYDRVTS